MNEGQFKEALEQQGIALKEEQMTKFQRYYEILVDWNDRMNLTAITDKEEVYLKHFYDSITAAFYKDFTEPLTIVDVGAGAGFPSLPLKICFPHINVTIVDSLNKRITFLNALASELNLKGVSFYHDRAEQFGRKKDHREQYDMAISRAVARLPVLTELCLPLVKKGGQFIAMKGAGASEELEDAKKAIQILGGDVTHTHQFQLPIEKSERSIINIRKEKATPKTYPRKPGTPNKQPIC
ncbi:16S rRNA (guanine(527)-N(7))-methyltransferase RsmG [Salipaludibacillus agaradhaerens]|uniref:Ribosomal RNA small subunit methyltransferase G n=1 Tax=Salipaludibacillus agaradhaerens TaxID=76935 RepID=A0A9Q4B534_SALAG|nr:16S rRNA (guanine(527)-N(7))-methyltransferase RsmG [Salipaludibacillus agaradhaerens]UJW59576.1 16S rRNA (guanine(527)-N(7))-methyltransferase RsmG [Bacillus sp. A116_S68]MCR6098488.1 16S rRNA (guanine(527)-N(7))-methyltransferase RsmG [Salipaludibacillus agaradhaerens]MCR6108548.1 16S rRNA (guanine(527)-N(7))-methyltransferase RsmG [Salipaludibacillus agaradhaerens]MCR6115882.1 16S rRNA (guanine(527)-N(7))-methyltransferase RsmG [Salipaludibacillus agaradhaerens]MCR6120569.1 16S rRNA (gua